MDDTVARDGAAAVDRFLAAERAESTARLTNQDGGCADVIRLHTGVDHRIRAPEENLPVTVEVRESTRRIARAGEPKQRVAHPGFRKLL
jgi:hypothetical protein